MAVRAEHFLAISADTADALFVVEATAMQINPASPGANLILANMVDCLRGSTAHHVVPAFICLISLLIAVGAHAETATTDASDSKRVQVLQVQEASATNESSVKKSKSAAIPAKKKVVQRKTISQTKAAANEGVDAAGAQLPNPNTPVQSTMTAVAPATPAPNDTLTHSAEQTGALTVGDRAVTLASGEDNNVGLSVANYGGTKEDPSGSALAFGNPPRAIADAEQTPGTQMAGQQVPSNSSSPLSQALATLSGAMVAAAFGWYLVSSSRRRAFG